MKRHLTAAGGKGREGVTLIELLVVLGIITLVASLAIVALAPFMRTRSLSAGAYAVRNVIWQAKTYAATHNVQAAVHFYTSEPPYLTIEWRVPAADDSWHGPVAKPTYLPREVRFYRPTNPVDRLVRDGKTAKLDTGLPAAVRQYRLIFSPGGSLFSGTPLGTDNVQIGLVGPKGTSEEKKTVIVLFASGLPYIEDAK